MTGAWRPSEPFAYSSGPKTARLAIVGDAWGQQDALVGQPFQGTAGQELSNLLSSAGIARRDCFLTNVFPLQPLAGKIENLCGKKAEVGSDYPFHPFSQGKYILPEYLCEVARLHEELAVVRPNLILALGNAPAWALLGRGSISSIRGTTTQTEEGWKILPTFSPRHILQSWEARPILLQDLAKAKREMEFPEIRRPQRTVLVYPTLKEIEEYCLADHLILSVDIETARRQMTSIGFAATRSHAIVIPFLTDEVVPQSYWQTTAEEVQALRLVKHLLERPTPKLFQNGLYDLQYLLTLGIRPAAVAHDTMLLHHSMFPELRKGLGFLGSIYTDEGSWKLLNKKTDSTKREE